MHRTTIVAPDDLLKRLRQIAAARGTSMAVLIREALEEKVDSAQRPKPRSLGLGVSGHTDTSRRAGDERPSPRSWR
jgi:plasmid stability protein